MMPHTPNQVTGRPLSFIGWIIYIFGITIPFWILLTSGVSSRFQRSFIPSLTEFCIYLALGLIAALIFVFSKKWNLNKKLLFAFVAVTGSALSFGLGVLAFLFGVGPLIH